VSSALVVDHARRIHEQTWIRATAGDLKPALAKALNAILQPVRDHFANDKDAAALLKQVRENLSSHRVACKQWEGHLHLYRHTSAVVQHKLSVLHNFVLWCVLAQVKNFKVTR
jgi:hypothetical protein